MLKANSVIGVFAIIICILAFFVKNEANQYVTIDFFSFELDHNNRKNLTNVRRNYQTVCKESFGNLDEASDTENCRIGVVESVEQYWLNA